MTPTTTEAFLFPTTSLAASAASPARSSHDDYERVALALVQACGESNSEMTVATRCEAALVPLLAEHGVNYAPQRELRVVTTRRRIDSQFGAVVTEYKERLVSSVAWEEATAQLVGYIEAIAPETNARDSHVGVVTDGRMLRFVTFEGGSAHEEHPGPLDGIRLRRYVETLVALGRRGLTQEHLVEDFATVRPAGTGLGRRLAIACYEALGGATAKTGMLQSEWQRLFAQSVNHSDYPPAHEAAYREVLGIPDDEVVDSANALFAIQTAYAIVVKLVATRVLSELHFGTTVLNFDAVSTADSSALHGWMSQLEEGQLLRACGIENLLEGDFFAWYAGDGQWTPNLNVAIHDVIQQLAGYEGRAPLLRPGALGDLFRQLYQRTLPAIVRHDLGEYYTPRWLAQAVLDGLPKNQDWRGLDPCCGSGTFVVEMIAEVLDDTKHLLPAARLEQVLRRVHGIDLNPLAVLTARVNYFLAIAALLADFEPGTDGIELPVYLGDAASIHVPADLDGVPALAYTLPTALGPLDVTLPLSLARQGARFGATMRAVERAVVAGDALAGCRALTDAIGKESGVAAVQDAIAYFVDALVALERQDWNRIWARIVKNFLTTAALEPYDRVAGNPPWVEWKDLPAGYRATINGLCKARGLFSDDGYVGGTDLNICVLIAHTVLERWVRPGGYLGFLMPRQLLQIRSSQGFRRWRLPDGEAISLLALADWTATRPFDAACQPVTYYLQRGIARQAIVPMRVHTLAKRSVRPPDVQATWNSVRPHLVVTNEGACQVGRDGGPYMIDDPRNLPFLLALLGECAYRGRRATETSPHGVYWVRPKPVTRALQGGAILVENALNPRARERLPRVCVPLETDLLFPLLRGNGIAPFKVTPSDNMVILPHDAVSGAKALPPDRMPPLTLAYLQTHQEVLERRGSYKEYRAGGPFYGLWRVGPYTFAPYKVVWPEMGELRAAVVTDAPTPWGERKMLVPEGKVNMVPCATADEAHYLCALLNAPLIRRAYRHMSSQIGRPSRLPFALPLYDPSSLTHRSLATVSRAAHEGAIAEARRETLLDGLLRRTLDLPRSYSAGQMTPDEHRAGLRVEIKERRATPSLTPKPKLARRDVESGVQDK